MRQLLIAVVSLTCWVYVVGQNTCSGLTIPPTCDKPCYCSTAGTAYCTSDSSCICAKGFCGLRCDLNVDCPSNSSFNVIALVATLGALCLVVAIVLILIAIWRMRAASQKREKDEQLKEDLKKQRQEINNRRIEDYEERTNIDPQSADVLMAGPASYGPGVETPMVALDRSTEQDATVVSEENRARLFAELSAVAAQNEHLQTTEGTLYEPARPRGISVSWADARKASVDEGSETTSRSTGGGQDATVPLLKVQHASKEDSLASPSVSSYDGSTEGSVSMRQPGRQAQKHARQQRRSPQQQMQFQYSNSNDLQQQQQQQQQQPRQAPPPHQQQQQQPRQAPPPQQQQQQPRQAPPPHQQQQQQPRQPPPPHRNPVPIPSEQRNAQQQQQQRQQPPPQKLPPQARQQQPPDQRQQGSISQYGQYQPQQQQQAPSQQQQPYQRRDNPPYQPSSGAQSPQRAGSVTPQGGRTPQQGTPQGGRTPQHGTMSPPRGTPQGTMSSKYDSQGSYQPRPDQPQGTMSSKYDSQGNYQPRPDQPGNYVIRPEQRDSYQSRPDPNWDEETLETELGGAARAPTLV